jgi:hypothetical protein
MLIVVAASRDEDKHCGRRYCRLLYLVQWYEIRCHCEQGMVLTRTPGNEAYLSESFDFASRNEGACAML